MPDGTVLQPQETGPGRKGAQNEQMRVPKAELQPQPPGRHPRLRLLEQQVPETVCPGTTARHMAISDGLNT